MKIVTLIPTTRNDGSGVTELELQGIVKQFYEAFGGSTVEGPVEGHWVDNGTVYRDQCMRLTVVLEREQLEDAKQLVLQVGRQLGQLAMYFEVAYYDGVQILTVT